MHRTSKKLPPSTAAKLTTPKRPPSAYQLAAAAVKAVANEHDLTLTGWLKAHPQDPARRTGLKDKAGDTIGYAYCTPGGYWWMTRGLNRNAPTFAQGEVTAPQAELPALPVTPAHTILATAAIANRHEKGLVVA